MTDEAEAYIYADNAATTPLSLVALQAMMPYLTTEFGNPGGIHRIARTAAEALDGARDRMAQHLGATSHEIYLTSGGSESDNWILWGAVRRYRDRYGANAPVCVITSSIEHHAILQTCRALERAGVTSVFLPVDELGHVHVDDLSRALDDARQRSLDAGVDASGCALVSVMLANNEVGTIEDIPALARCAHDHNVHMHTDAVQAVGHIPVDVRTLGVDALSLSAHKFHGPRGIGALYLREDFSIPPLIDGGAQERGERAGTENVAGAVGMEAALAEALDGLDVRRARVAQLRDRLVRHTLDTCPDVRYTGDPNSDRRLPSIASFVCHDVDGELLVVLLDRAGVAAATGSACSTGSTDPSHVVQALGFEDSAWSHGSLRLSLSDDVTDADIELLCDRVPRCIKRAHLLSGMRS